MNLLLTNDDGIDAPGLAALRSVAKRLNQGRVVVVAPAGPMSECSHCVSTREPIRVERRGETEFAVHGSPADCVRVALTTDVLGGFRPDWVLSGINAGGNLGVDIYYSGTVAAAREAAMFGVPAIAISHYLRRGLAVDWDTAGVRAEREVRKLTCEQIGAQEFWNINLPHLDPDATEPKAIRCEPGRRPLPVRFASEDKGRLRYDGVYSERECEPDSDVAECFGGRIAISKLSV
ncbi:MAG: 5'/3'-nucleotidase SurE [Verrucomicrobiia bacterium]|jgi:5'-nucleotidase